jgi:alkylation response protein AidB-like acyl-CoA dehydrogenase
VRKFEQAEEEYLAEVWRAMAELRMLGMTFPSELGGEGCTLLDMFGLYVELGRHLVPSPHLETVALVGNLLAEHGSTRQKAEIMPQVAKGELILSAALMEPEGVYGPAGVTLEARRRGEGFVLNGAKVLVPFVKSARRILCAVRTGEGKGEEGISLLLVDQNVHGLSHEKTPSISHHPLYTLVFDDVLVGENALVGAEGKGWKLLSEAMLKAGVLQSAMVVGAGERVLEITAGYAKERSQFGQTIGRHQAVQYLVTDIAIDTHIARLLSLQAAWLISTGRPFRREASLAKAASCKAAVTMAHRAHEVHAGIGFMVDYDLQLYTMRAKHWEWNLGDYRYHLERAVSETALP